MHVARSPESAIFEVMVLDIWDAIRHIRFSCQKSARPYLNLNVASQRPNQPRNTLGRLVNQQFRSNRAISKFGASQVQMVREFIPKSEAYTEHSTGLGNNVETNDLRFLPSIQGKRRQLQRMARWHNTITVASVEPLWLRPYLTLVGFAAFEPHLEHPHRVSKCACFSVHRTTHTVQAGSKVLYENRTGFYLGFCQE